MKYTVVNTSSTHDQLSTVLTTENYHSEGKRRTNYWILRHGVGGWRLHLARVTCDRPVVVLSMKIDLTMYLRPQVLCNGGRTFFYGLGVTSNSRWLSKLVYVVSARVPYPKIQVPVEYQTSMIDFRDAPGSSKRARVLVDPVTWHL